MKQILAALIIAAGMVAYFVVGDDVFAPEAPVAVVPVPELSASEAQEPEMAASQAEIAAAVQVEPEPTPGQIKPLAVPAVVPAPIQRKPVPVASKPEAVLEPKPVVAAAAKSSVAPVKPEAPAPQDMRLTIREIQFDGVTAFSHSELQQVVQEFIGQELDLEQAFVIPARISSYYQSKNMVARATLVGSLERNGVLKVGVIETKMSQTQLNQQLSIVSAAEKAVQAAPQLSQDEETALILKQYAKQSRQYELLVDNQGLESTGARRVGVGLVWNDALGQGNTFSVQGIKTQGSQFLQAAFAWATGLDGLKLGLRVSDLSYEVVEAVQDATYANGEAVKKGLFLAYELVNTPANYSSLGLRYDTAKLRNQGMGLNESAYYDTRVMGIEFKGFEREMVPGGAVFTYDARLSKGEVDMAGSPNQQADLQDENTGGTFTKFLFTGSLLQPLGGISSAYFGLTLQDANKNLDASEKLYLGGPLGVRAYGVGEGAGSKGQIATFELRQRLSAKTTLAEFYDVGRIRSWKDAGGNTQPGTSLSGVGLSLTHKLDSGVNVKATWARRTGDAPEDNEAYDRNRFWLSLETRF
jgi:hemolysin activation/secretion protein